MRLTKKSKFEKPIDRLLDALDRETPGSDDYVKLLNQAEQLMGMFEKETNRRVSANTVWLVLGNIAGILAIVAYEQKHVWASRGINFVLRPKTD